MVAHDVERSYSILRMRVGLDIQYTAEEAHAEFFSAIGGPLPFHFCRGKVACSIPSPCILSSRDVWRGMRQQRYL